MCASHEASCTASTRWREGSGGHHQAIRLLELSRLLGARLIALGDNCQTKAIEQEKPFCLMQELGLSRVDLNLRCDVIEPLLEHIQSRDAMFLAEAAHVAGLRFPLIGYFVPRLPFDPVELVEELERLCGRLALFLPRLEGVGKAPSGVGHAAQMRGAFQCRPGRLAVTHHDAAIAAEEGLRMFLPATGFILEQRDRLAETFLRWQPWHFTRRAGSLVKCHSCKISS